MKYYEVNFRIEAPQQSVQTCRDVLSAMAGDIGFEAFEDTAGGMKGYVQQQLFSKEALNAILADFPVPRCTLSYTVGEAEYSDWNEQWEQRGFDPIVVGHFVIHDGKHLPLASATSLPTGGQSQLEIEIHARQAFGTGTHETTRMMVGTIAETEMTGKRVLDCGTGTGILAIAALKAGADEAVGYDIDEWSTENARHNAVLNGVDRRFTIVNGDASVLDSVEHSFDVVLANINRNILLADMQAMAAKLKPGGILVISGFLTQDTGLLLDKAKSLSLRLEKQRQEAGWICLKLRKH